jgi:hypothetical protein
VVYSASGQVTGVWIRPVAGKTPTSDHNLRQATTFSELLAAGKMSEAEALVAPSMRKELSDAAFTRVWQQAAAMGGAFKRFDSAVGDTQDGCQRATLRGHWDHAQFDLAVTLGADGLIIGVLLIPVP